MWTVSFRTKALLGLVVIGLFSVGVHANFFNDKPDITVVENLEQFEKTVVESESLWMVHFCTPTSEVCQKIAVVYGIVGQLFKGIIHLAAIQAETPGGIEIAQKYSIPTNVSPLLYWFLDDKSSPSGVDPKLDGVEALVGHMVNTIIQVLTDRGKTMGIEGQFQKPQFEGKGGKNKSSKKFFSSGPSKTVTIKGQEEWEEKVLNNPLVALVAFTAPWCGHCKMLKSDWDEAAEKLHGQGAQMVWMDATDPANEPIAGQFQVPGFPTIFIFPGGAPKVPSLARQYPGERKVSAMVKYVLQEVDESGTPKEIPELISPDLLKAECQGHNHICVLAALPHILDSGASGRNKHRDLLTKVSKTFRGGAFSFLWFQGGSQPELESALELTFGYPALVAYSMDRHAFAVLRGSFNEKAVTSFLHGVTSGRVPVAKLKKEKVPKIEGVEPWDGKDAAPPEEEFDLADIMGNDDDDVPEGEAKKDEL